MSIQVQGSTPARQRIEWLRDELAIIDAMEPCTYQFEKRASILIRIASAEAQLAREIKHNEYL